MTYVIDNETHPTLTKEELAEIREFREKLAYKSVSETDRLIFEWARTGKLTRRQHYLLCKYHYQGN